VLSAVLNVKGAVYMLALGAVSVSAAKADFQEAPELPLWGLLSLGFLIASLFLLRDMKSTGEPEDVLIPSLGNKGGGSGGTSTACSAR
jgi:hypothetical protein